ncbi:hypothetical protein CCM_00169 [Cordyceps militaris CM01]|uniref:Uncharacterized protein n=1 Tax=Cordyceps militaris (strain CM01) TaxID=983644 RepID=G3J7P9_CORMM|nr:uncharacterized protein CCM_00169 [Cordyceps militaris CM01]EGX95515.1 hypothetical protein CCM_00169 [Cordyceps militaris CM01]
MLPSCGPGDWAGWTAVRSVILKRADKSVGSDVVGSADTRLQTRSAISPHRRRRHLCSRFSHNQFAWGCITSPVYLGGLSKSVPSTSSAGPRVADRALRLPATIIGTYQDGKKFAISPQALAGTRSRLRQGTKPGQYKSPFPLAREQTAQRVVHRQHLADNREADFSEAIILSSVNRRLRQWRMLIPDFTARQPRQGFRRPTAPVILGASIL